jgi:large subunit ribosomal protein L24
MSLADADAASFIASDGRAPISGKLGLRLELESSGLTPLAFVGSLAGAGTVSLRDGRLAALDPRTFDAVMRAVDGGMPIESERIKNVAAAALDSGQLAVPALEGAVTISAGQVRLANVVTRAEGASVALTGNLDLTEGMLDARIVLSGLAATGDARRPDIFITLSGPMTTPSRSLDVAALSGWLTLRKIEQQAKEVEALEAARRAALEREKREAEETARRAALEREKREAEEAARREALRASPPDGAASTTEKPAAPTAPAKPAAPGQPRPSRPAQSSATAPPPVPPAVDPWRTVTPPIELPPLPAPIEVKPPPGAERRSAPAQPGGRTTKPSAGTPLSLTPPPARRPSTIQDLIGSEN